MLPSHAIRIILNMSFKATGMLWINFDTQFPEMGRPQTLNMPEVRMIAVVTGILYPIFPQQLHRLILSLKLYLHRKKKKTNVHSPFDNWTLKSLFWIGANYHYLLDLPDPSGLNWMDAIIQCLKSVYPRPRMLPDPAPSSPPLTPEKTLRSRCAYCTITSSLVLPPSLPHLCNYDTRSRLLLSGLNVHSRQPVTSVFPTL